MFIPCLFYACYYFFDEIVTQHTTMSMTSDNTTFVNFTIRTQPNKIVIDKNNLKWRKKRKQLPARITSILINLLTISCRSGFARLRIYQLLIKSWMEISLTNLFRQSVIDDSTFRWSKHMGQRISLFCDYYTSSSQIFVPFSLWYLNWRRLIEIKFLMWWERARPKNSVLHRWEFLP